MENIKKEMQAFIEASGAIEDIKDVLANAQALEAKLIALEAKLDGVDIYKEFAGKFLEAGVETYSPIMTNLNVRKQIAEYAQLKNLLKKLK